MRKSKVFTVVGVVALSLAIACLIGWFASREPKPQEPVVETDAKAGLEKVANKNPFFTVEKTSRKVGETTPTNEAAPQAALTGTNDATADWDDKIDDILGAEIEEDKKAEKLLALYPNMPEKTQFDAIEHLVNLTSDEAFAPLAKILTDPKTPEEISDVLLTDLANRPAVIRMPLLLQVAKNADHPKAAEAKELLEVYLEEDYGNDWDKWEKATEQWLKDNPD